MQSSTFTDETQDNYRVEHTQDNLEKIEIYINGFYWNEPKSPIFILENAQQTMTPESMPKQHQRNLTRKVVVTNPDKNSLDKQSVVISF